MPRETSAQSESESERVPSKKQKKREESPADDPMDEDVEDKGGGEEDGGEEEEYEIETILDSSTEIFPHGEVGYFVSWKGYPASENSWVRESDAPNADELISRYLDVLSKKKVAEKKKSSAKSRKSAERPQEPKKRGRASTKSKVESDDEEPERSPVQPTTKKQKKEKAPAPAKKTESKEEQEYDIEFVTMEKYMDLDAWDTLIGKVETIERDDDQNLYVYGVLTTGDQFRLPSSTANIKFPQKIIKFYEDNLRWKSMDESL